MNDEPVSPPVDLSAITAAGLPSDPTRRIYTNRNLDMSEIEAVGFDMDYTVAQYHQLEMDQLSVRMTVQKLVEKHGYPPEIRDAKLDFAFVIRGLVVDKETGHIFKVNAHRQVGRCYHGYRKVDQALVREMYGRKPIRLGSDRYAWVDTLFSLSEATLLAGIIQFYEGADRELPWSYRQLFDDIRTSIDEAHQDNSLKADILGHLDKYVQQDPDLAPTLHKLRSAGKRLFLLTNSEAYYTDAVMAHLLDGQLPFYRTWRDYFDVVVVSSNKPRFFTEEAPFIELDADHNAVGEARSFQRGVVYEGGNVRALETMLGVSSSGVIYVGDHIYSDIVHSKKASVWRTALVVQEMEENIRLTHEQMSSLQRIHELEVGARLLDDGINYHLTLLKSLGRMRQLIGSLTGPESHVIESARERAKVELDVKRELLRKTLGELQQVETQVDARFNPYWGRLFQESNERSQFGAQVMGYSDIYTSRVSNFLAYSPGQMFRAPREVMPHERS